QKDNPNFSFSGLKTAVSLHLAKREQPLPTDTRRDICASIEGAIVKALVTKAALACEREGLGDLVLAGGVAANGYLREEAQNALKKIGGPLHVPPKAWCTDNAAMIGAAGLKQLQAGDIGGLSAVPRAYWPLG